MQICGGWHRLWVQLQLRSQGCSMGSAPSNCGMRVSASKREEGCQAAISAHGFAGKGIAVRPSHLQVVGFIEYQDSALPRQLLDGGADLGIDQIVVGQEDQLCTACQLSGQIEWAGTMHLPGQPSSSASPRSNVCQSWISICHSFIAKSIMSVTIMYVMLHM